jgi:putative phage-type endonuclease
MTETRQGTPAWFDARRGKLTASNFGAAAGVCPWTSRAKALRIAIGEEEWKGDLRACLWGTKNEKNAVKDYMVRTGNVVMHKGLYTHPDYPWLGGSPDGLVGTEGIIEVKCPFVHQRPHLKIPYHYYCQVNGLMEIMDKEWCDFVSWTVNGMKIYRVYRDKELFDFLMERYGRFYACMKRGVADLPNVTAAEKREVSSPSAAQTPTESAHLPPTDPLVGSQSRASRHNRRP